MRQSPEPVDLWPEPRVRQWALDRAVRRHPWFLGELHRRHSLTRRLDLELVYIYVRAIRQEYRRILLKEKP